jgi:microcystin-dependent protein
MDPFVAEIRMFPYNFPPKGWAWCDGQLLPISQNTALFSLLGTTYGGDGKSTFALPDLTGAAALHPGQGAGLSQRFLGEQSGTDTVTLIDTEMPVHSHTITVSRADSIERVAQDQLPAGGVGVGMYKTPAGNDPTVTLNVAASPIAGGGLPHNNMQPYLTVYFNIALQGVFPARP